MKLHKICVAAVAVMALSAQPLWAQGAGAGAASQAAIGGFSAATVFVGAAVVIVAVGAANNKGTTGTR